MKIDAVVTLLKYSSDAVAPEKHTHEIRKESDSFQRVLIAAHDVGITILHKRANSDHMGSIMLFAISIFNKNSYSIPRTSLEAY